MGVGSRTIATMRRENILKPDSVILESQFSLNFNRKRGRTSVKGTLNLRFIASREEEEGRRRSLLPAVTGEASTTRCRVAPGGGGTVSGGEQ